MKILRRVEKDLNARYPSARVTSRRASIVSVIGRDLSGLRVPLNGLQALDAAGIEVISSQDTGRRVDVQFIVAADKMDAAIRALHARFCEDAASDSGSQDAALFRAA